MCWRCDYQNPLQLYWCVPNILLCTTEWALTAEGCTMASKHISLNQKPQIELFLHNLCLDHKCTSLNLLTQPRHSSVRHCFPDHHHKCVDITLVPSKSLQKAPSALHCVTCISKEGKCFFTYEFVQKWWYHSLWVPRVMFVLTRYGASGVFESTADIWAGGSCAVCACKGSRHVPCRCFLSVFILNFNDCNPH